MARRLSALAEARVDLARLADNYRAVASLAGRPVIAVVKADAYGHGAVPVARALVRAGAAMLAVAHAEEGIALRAAGIGPPILVFAGCLPGHAAEFRAHALTPVVTGEESLEGALAAVRAGVPQAHLEVDTGMTRLGLGSEQCVAAARRLVEAGGVIEGVMTHLAAAEEDSARTTAQLDRFDAALADLARHGVRPSFVHAAHSAGLALLRPTHTAVRPGLALYGLLPRPCAPALRVRPVMSVRARVLQLRAIDAGTPVSYGGRWRASRASRIATIAFGYADGLPRTEAAAARGFVMLRGRRAPLAGTVCMDFTTVDVTEIPDVEEGDDAVVLGESPTAWDLADWAGTNAWQAFTAIGPRVRRSYTGTESHRATEDTEQ